jgi:hypothetical protein
MYGQDLEFVLTVGTVFVMFVMFAGVVEFFLNRKER